MIYGDRESPVILVIVTLADINSPIALFTEYASDVSLIIITSSFPKDGKAFFNPCGITILDNTCQFDKPSALPASV